jgi:hypothetical protein
MMSKAQDVWSPMRLPWERLSDAQHPSGLTCGSAGDLLVFANSLVKKSAAVASPLLQALVSNLTPSAGFFLTP